MGTPKLAYIHTVSDEMRLCPTLCAYAVCTQAPLTVHRVTFERRLGWIEEQETNPNTCTCNTNATLGDTSADGQRQVIHLM